MQNILVTVEFEDKAAVLVESAAELARKFGSKVWLIHIAAPDPDFIGYEIGPQYIRDSRAEDLRKEHRLLQKYADHLNNRGINAEGLLIQGGTTDLILEECEKLNIDLIVIGHHKHGMLYKLFFGNTDIDIVNRAKLPVLVIPLN